MANLQAIAADGLTIIYLLAEGTGTTLDPYISKFKLVDQNLLATEATLAAIANAIPEFVFDSGRLAVTTGLNQPLTLTELQGVVVSVAEQDPIDISKLATEQSLTNFANQFTWVDDRLKVDANVSLPEFYPIQGDVGIDNYSDLATLLANTRLQVDVKNNVSTVTDVTLDKSGLATDANQVTTNTQIGTINETAPANDTASSGLNGRLQRIAQRLTTLIGLFPSSLGAKTAANSLAVTLSTDGVASGISNQIGEVQTTPTANTILGRLKIIGDVLSGTVAVAPNITRGGGVIDSNTQRVTLATDGAGVAALSSIDNKTPTVGQKTSANSSPVVLASDQIVTTALPDNAATEAKQDTIITYVDGIETALNNPLDIVVNNDQTELLSDLLYHAQSRNLINGKYAQAFNILGNRTTFANTTGFHDLCEFLTTDLVFTPVTTSSALEIVSTNANDTAAGTGTRSVKITYLNNSGLLVESPAITLNGTTPVPVGFSASAILWMEAWEGGTGTVSAGNITLRNSATPTIIYEQITAGGNKSLSGRFTVPSNCTAYLLDYDFAAIAQTMDIRLRATVDSYTRQNNNGRYLFQTRKFLAASQNIAQDGRLLKFGAGSTIKVSAIPGATTGNPRCDANFGILLVEN